MKIKKFLNSVCLCLVEKLDSHFSITYWEVLLLLLAFLCTHLLVLWFINPCKVFYLYMLDYLLDVSLFVIIFWLLHKLNIESNSYKEKL